jgi:hypothetical protein
MKKKINQNEILIPEEDVEAVFNRVSEDITEFLIQKNLELVEYIRLERYEDCAIIKECLNNFINDTSTILNKATNIRRQSLYTHFHSQSDYLRETISKEFLK